MDDLEEYDATDYAADAVDDDFENCDDDDDCSADTTSAVGLQNGANTHCLQNFT